MTVGTPTSQRSRLVAGGLVDRRFPLRFTFDGAMNRVLPA